MWLDEHVRGIMVAVDNVKGVHVVAAKVRPSVRKGPLYKANGLKGNLSYGACDCKGRKSGYCKHVVAVAYRLWGLQKQGVTESQRTRR